MNHIIQDISIKSSYGAVVAQQIANLLVLSSNLSASSFYHVFTCRQIPATHTLQEHSRCTFSKNTHTWKKFAAPLDEQCQKTQIWKPTQKCAKTVPGQHANSQILCSFLAGIPFPVARSSRRNLHTALARLGDYTDLLIRNLPGGHITRRLIVIWQHLFAFLMENRALGEETQGRWIQLDVIYLSELVFYCLTSVPMLMAMLSLSSGFKSSSALLNPLPTGVFNI